MDNKSENADVLEAGNIASLHLLPKKSKKKYETVYANFMDWRARNKINSFSENVMLAYFGELATKYKSSTLWANYSMLRSTLNINHNISIEYYGKLRALLKHKSEGYVAKKAKTLTPEEINKFIQDAPDIKYLATKVAIIMGLMGACHANELHLINIADFQDLGTAVIVTVPKTKTRMLRQFTITNAYYNIYKKYSNLRPNNTTSPAFFLNYENGRCTDQKIGINKFGAMGKQIAKFLNLPNPELYTGHTFRRSATLLHVTTSKSTALVEDYKDISMASKMYVNPPYTVSLSPSSSSSEDSQSSSSRDPSNMLHTSPAIKFTQNSATVNRNINFENSLPPTLNISNCSNVTINFCNNKTNL